MHSDSEGEFLAPPESANEGELAHRTSKKVSPLITGSLFLTAVGAIILCLVWVLKVGGYGGLKTDNGTWHFVLMTLFIISTGIGATSFRIFTSLPRHIVKLIHAISLSFAFAVSTVALYSIFYFHDLKSIPNMYTLHSWLGLAFVILFGLQLCGGLFSFLFPLVSPATRTWILPYHRASGIIILAAIVAVGVIGINEKLVFEAAKYKLKTAFGIVPNLFGTFLFGFGLVAIAILVRPDLKREENRRHY